jgi:hypothetical protein
MKHGLSILLTVGSCILSTVTLAQQPYNNCSAAFVSSKLLVNMYTPKGTCRLPATAKGDLTVQTVDLSPTKIRALEKIGFKVAIRDKATGTLHLFSEKTFRQVPMQQVLSKCKKGDHIVLMTVDSQYALPHNEILVF